MCIAIPPLAGGRSRTISPCRKAVSRRRRARLDAEKVSAAANAIGHGAVSVRRSGTWAARVT